MSDYFVVRRGATALPNGTVWDERIGFAALGILARALATPPGAHLGYRAFSGRGMGEKAVRSAMRELEAAGYRHRFPVRGDGGRLRTVTVFSDVAISEEEALAEYVGAEDRARVVGRRRPDDDPGDGPDAGPGGGGSSGGPSGSGPASGGGGSYPQKGSPQESYPQDHGPVSHRAAPPAARWPEPRNDGGNSESTVRRSTAARSTAARSTAPRSTVPRSRTALSLRDTNSSSFSLRSEEGGTVNQTGPDRTEGAGTAREGVGAAGRVRSGQVRSGEKRPGNGGSAEGGAGRARPPRTTPAALDAAPVRAGDGSGNTPRKPSRAPGAAERAPGVPGDGSGPEITSDRLSRLLGECLPESMRVMDAVGAWAVGALLTERLAAGWRPGQIRAAMGGRLPEDVGRMSALVAARLRINVDPALAPDGGSVSSAGAVGGVEGAASVRAAEEARWEARRRRSEALAAPVRRDEGPGEDPLWARARAEAERSLPAGTSPMALARAAAGLMARWLADPAGAVSAAPVSG